MQLKNGQRISLRCPGVRKFRRNRKSLYLAPLRWYGHFCVFSCKFKMAAVFQDKNFWKLGRLPCWNGHGVENFDEIALSGTVKEIRPFLCFCRKNSKWPLFFERQKNFENWVEYLLKMPWGPKTSTKLLYLSSLRRYRQCCAENLKNQNGRHFLKDKNFWKLGRVSC